MNPSYSGAEIKRALAMLASSGSLLDTSKATGIARSTLRKWRDGRLPKSAGDDFVAPTEQEAAEVGAERAAEFRSIQSLYLDHLRDPEVVADASAKDAAVIAGILDDKAVRAEGGERSSTVNIKIAFVSPSALRELSAGVIDSRETTGLVIDVPALNE